MALEQMSSHLKFTKLKAMRCADANKSARAKLGRRQRGFPGWPTPCLVYAGQTEIETDRLAANDSWLLSPSASEIRTAEPQCCSPNGLEVSPHFARERESLSRLPLMHAGIYIIPPSQLKTLDSRQVPRTKTLTQIRLELESATALGARQAGPRPKPNINYNHATRAQDSDNRTTSKLIEINANAQSRGREVERVDYPQGFPPGLRLRSGFSISIGNRICQRLKSTSADRYPLSRLPPYLSRGTTPLLSNMSKQSQTFGLLLIYQCKLIQSSFLPARLIYGFHFAVC